MDSVYEQLQDLISALQDREYMVVVRTSDGERQFNPLSKVGQWNRIESRGVLEGRKE